MVKALNEAIYQCMLEDKNIIVLGENVCNRYREETCDLDKYFSKNRVIDMPISEAAFTGFANGAAMAGLRPIVEFQVAGLIYPAFDQIVNQAAKLRLMLGGQCKIPVTFFLMGAGAGGGLGAGLIAFCGATLKPGFETISESVGLQSLFNGAKSFGLINPKIKKTKETMTDQILIDPSYVKGHKLIIKKLSLIHI